METGTEVVAQEVITEGGLGNPDPEADFPDPGFIHAQKGDLGTVRDVEHREEPNYTVGFGETCVTLLDNEEIQMVDRLVEMCLERLNEPGVMQDEALRQSQCYDACTMANEETIVLKWDDTSRRLTKNEGGWEEA